MSNRLAPQEGELINRSMPVSFRFEGRSYSGFLGDSITSALYAHDVRLLGRSFKYHRPRGVYSLAHHDANVMVEDAQRTNMRGDVTPIAPHLDVRAVNTTGGLEKDLLRFTGLFSKMMPVGFYYKCFHTPRKLFPFYESQLRKIAGLGRINPAAQAVATPKRYDFCDALVVGSGPAGLAAAIEAAERGLKVIVVDDMPYIGGSLRYQWHNDPAAKQTLDKLIDRARALNLDIRTSTEAAGCYGDLWIALIDSKCLTKLRANTLIVAAGAFEQPAVFHNNDVPGVMLASAAQRLMRLYGVRPFQRGVLLAANGDGYRAALDLHGAGVNVAAIADLRPDGEPTDLAQRAADAGIPIHRGHTVYEVAGAGGRVSAAALCRVDAQGHADAAHMIRIDCDGVAMSVGWAPNGGLLYQAGAKFTYDPAVEQFLPQRLPPGVFAAGRVNGVFDLHAQMEDGARAALAAAAYLSRYAGPVPPAVKHGGAAPSHPYPIFHHPKGKNFVDLDEDIHLMDFVNAVQEGYDNIELIKRYTTVGMGPTQGKLSNMNAVRILAKLTQQSIDQTGTTTSRPFYQPVPMRHLAGRRFHPHRVTPMHQWHEQAAAKFTLVGVWHRPEYYAQPGRTREDLILAEAKHVREKVGLIDVGTLGKIEVFGRDAVKMLERTYTGKFENLAVGKTRYCLALDESGVIIDDGVVARLGDDRYYVTATTSGVDYLFREMQRNAMLWKLDVGLVNVTGRYTGMNIAGPMSRQVLAGLTNVDLSAEGFPYLGVREGEVAGVPARLLRVGFVGELGYEVHVPAASGLAVWQALMQAGAAHGIAPFGVEAQRLLRLEKGHIIIIADTDALTNPIEAGVEWALGKDKPFYIGQRSLDIVRKQQLTRKLAGFAFPQGYAGGLPEECNLIIERGEMTGRITSIAKRSTVGPALGLAFVRPTQANPGTPIDIRLDSGEMVQAKIVATPFYDPEHARQKQ